ncbi:hypothetical protein EG68_12345 [Paragonimus skrjabini miyazakii]|uniref:Uncharacterized protein n=1 Tax=Paragonimus skrjabini miyazakii TaxID=59628 RepID=A0A8S9YCS5_9TREM|nr:hypothetical protein EG68_12345 [Paragonimus skrjabini miyazakii]
MLRTDVIITEVISKIGTVMPMPFRGTLCVLITYTSMEITPALRKAFHVGFPTYLGTFLAITLGVINKQLLAYCFKSLHWKNE